MAVSHPLRNGGDLVYACRRRASAGRCRKAGARRRPRTTSSRRVGPSATVRAEKIFIPASASSGCFPICTCRRSTDLSRPRLTSPRNIETILRRNPRSSTARSVVRQRPHSRRSRNMRLVMAPRGADTAPRATGMITPPGQTGVHAGAALCRGRSGPSFVMPPCPINTDRDTRAIDPHLRGVADQIDRTRASSPARIGQKSPLIPRSQHGTSIAPDRRARCFTVSFFDTSNFAQPPA